MTYFRTSRAPALKHLIAGDPAYRDLAGAIELLARLDRIAPKLRVKEIIDAVSPGSGSEGHPDAD
jgi:hypothetical protein